MLLETDWILIHVPRATQSDGEANRVGAEKDFTKLYRATFSGLGYPSSNHQRCARVNV
jgi:hypothetical protein